ncbi:SRPBCC domain-containing protein [Sporosarcina sp. Te-1]|uniref:SRPBCC family protein n=1 Tax=Sporosarcina sp. Te-1 TaxID=2818390 RepID=UPI001FB12D91|nr:SRPBCC domain-containing protein [Sporosarcina sp. Te-1]
MNDIRKEIVIKALIEEVWKFVGTADGLAAWFMPNDMEPVEGESFELQAGPWGKSSCRVTRVQKPYALAFDWGKDWNLSFILEGQGNQTGLTLIHGGWHAGGETEFGEPHDVVQPRMDGGWTGLVQKLKQVAEAKK